MSPALPSVRRLRREVIALLCWPTRGPSCLACSTHATSLTTCIYSTLRPQRTISLPDQRQALRMHHLSLFFYSLGIFRVARKLYRGYCYTVDHIPTRMLVLRCFVKFILQRLLLSSRLGHTLSFRSIMCPARCQNHVHFQRGDRALVKSLHCPQAQTPLSRKWPIHPPP